MTTLPPVKRPNMPGWDELLVPPMRHAIKCVAFENVALGLIVISGIEVNNGKFEYHVSVSVPGTLVATDEEVRIVRQVFDMEAAEEDNVGARRARNLFMSVAIENDVALAR